MVLMAAPLPYGVFVRVWREERDRKHGDVIRVDERMVGPVGLYPRTSTEPGGDQRTAIVQSGMVMLIPPNANLTAYHQVETPDGRVWKVTGEPGQYQSPLTGWAPGGQVELERVTG